MPLQKSSSQKSGKSRMKSTAKTSPARLKSRSRTAPPVLPARPLTNQVRPGMSPRRVKQRAVRREGARQAVNHVQPQRPRPNVRPTGRPVKVMPRTPAPAIPRVKARPKVRVPKPAPRASSGSTPRRRGGGTCRLRLPGPCRAPGERRRSGPTHSQTATG